MDQLEAVQLHSDSEPDTPIWLLENFGTYTTKSNYRFLSYGGGVTNQRMRRLLASRLPLKLKIFLWLAIQGRLQTGVALKHK